MSEATRALAEAIATGLIGSRVWFYSNYHCNLACTYCLSGSAPGVEKRELSSEQMLAAAGQAVELGFTELGVTGGEPFLVAGMGTTVRALAALLPTVVLTNGTLFTGGRETLIDDLAGIDAAVQISLDSATPARNDEARGDHNFAKVVAAIPRLVGRGVRVRIATTGDLDAGELADLCALHRSLGIPDEDHVCRPVVRRGRAAERGEGVAVTPTDLPPELTITTDGAFWSPFGPTVTDGRVDTDLLVTRTTDPLRTPAEHLVRAVTGREPGADSTLNIR